MVGSIDPRCEKIRGTHWPVKVAGVFGTRVAENHLGQRSPTAPTGRTYGCKRSDQTIKKLLWHGGRPHMGPGCEKNGRSATSAVTTRSGRHQVPVAVLPTAKSLSAFSLKPQSDRLLEATMLSGTVDGISPNESVAKATLARI